MRCPNTFFFPNRVRIKSSYSTFFFLAHNPMISSSHNPVIIKLVSRHDIWHFLGGAGVFFVFMFIITIDDDIKYKDRNAINVF